MTTVEVCRICLAHNTRVSTMDPPLQKFYQKITNKSFNIEDQRPSVLCYVCYHTLKKYHRFTENAIKADEVLQLFYNSRIQNTEQIFTRMQKTVLFMALKTSPVTNVNIAKKMTLKAEVKNEDDEGQRNEDRNGHEEGRIVYAKESSKDIETRNYGVKQETNTIQTEDRLSEGSLQDLRDVTLDGIEFKDDNGTVSQENMAENSRFKVNATVLPEDINKPTRLEIKGKTSLDLRGTEGEDILSTEDTLLLHDLHHSSDIDDDVSVDGIKLDEDNEVDEESYLGKKTHTYGVNPTVLLEDINKPTRLEIKGKTSLDLRGTEGEDILSTEDTLLLHDLHHSSDIDDDVSVDGIKLEEDNEVDEESYLGKKTHTYGVNPTVLLEDINKPTRLEIKGKTSLDLRGTEGEDILSTEDTLLLHNLHHSSDIDDDVSVDGIKLEEDNEVDEESYLGKKTHTHGGNATVLQEDINKPTRFEIKVKKSLDLKGTEGDDILSTEDTLQLHDLHHSSDIDDDVSVDGIKLEEDNEVDEESYLGKKTHTYGVNPLVLLEDINKQTRFEIKEKTSLDLRGTEGEDNILSAEDTLQLHDLHHSSDIDDDVSVDGIKLEKDNEVDEESYLGKKTHTYGGAPRPKRRKRHQPTTPQGKLREHNTIADEIITTGSSDVMEKLSGTRKKRSNRNYTNSKRYGEKKSNKQNNKTAREKLSKRNNCGEKVTTCHLNTTITAHSKTHTDINPFTCSYCKKQLSNKSNLARHLKLHQGEKHQCDTCGKMFKDKRYLKSHLMVHTKEEKKEKSFTCRECGKKFANQIYLSRHLRRHKSERPALECHYCGKKFTEKHHLTVHIKWTDGHMVESQLHKEKKQKHLCISSKHLCRYCGKKLPNNRYLTRHLNIHTGEKPFECDHCGKKFMEKNHLIRHFKIHKYGESFTCYVCGIHFTKYRSLLIHERVHATGKFVCDYCEKKFKLKIKLKRHIVSVHLGKTEKVCAYCGKRFKTNYHLARHYKIHTGENSLLRKKISLKNMYKNKNKSQ